MTPQDTRQYLINIQAACNAMILTSMAVSNAIGEFVASVDNGTYTDEHNSNLVKCLQAQTNALIKYCDATGKLGAK